MRPICVSHEILDLEQEIQNIRLVCEGTGIADEQVQRLAQMLRQYSRLVPTLESAKAIERFAAVAFGGDVQAAAAENSPIGNEARKLLDNARKTEQPLRIFVHNIYEYNRLLTQWDLICEIVPVLGDRDGRGAELAEFLRLNGDSVRDLADAGDTNELAEVVTSLQVSWTCACAPA